MRATWCLLSFALSSAALATPSTGATDGLIRISSLQEPESLTGRWRMHPGDDPGWAAADVDDSDWDTVEVPRGLGLQGYEDLTGFFWYRLRIVLDASARITEPPPQLAVRIGNLDSAGEVFINGVFVGEIGHVPTADAPEAVIFHDHNPAFAVPAAAIDDGVVVVAVRGYRAATRAASNPSRGGITHAPVIIGDARQVARDIILADVDDVALALVFVIVGLYHLYLWSRRREQRPYIWFGLFSIVIGSYIFFSRDIAYQVLDSALWKNKLGFVGVFLSFPIFIEFLWPFLGVPIRWWWRVLQVIALVFAALNLAWPTLWFTQRFLVVFEVVVLFPEIIGLMALLIRKAIAKNPEARTILVGGIAIAMTALNNVAVERNLYRAPEITNFAFLVFVLSMAVSLANRFARVYGELDEKNAALVRQDKLKDEFLANTSHELRTPLNGILGIAEGLLDNGAGLEEQVRDDLRMIQTSGHRLSTLINDILDFSKLREGKLELHCAPVDLRSLTDIVLRLLGPLASRKGLTLINAVDASLPMVRADENRLQQIVVNLVGNALKFTEEGTVTVSAVADDDSVTIAVEDTGIGIAAADLGRIFNAFEQADGSTARTYGGTGLGLSVTRQLVDLHRGHVNVTSTLGKGSRFTVRLPRADAARATERPVLRETADSFSEEVTAPQQALVLPSRPSGEAVSGEGPATSVAVPSATFNGRHMRVLVVDDEPINIRVLESHLVPLHFEVHKAESGAEALALLDGGLHPDLVLLDVMMPRMSGYEVCLRIRERFTANEVPVVLVTAKDRVADVIAGFEAGATDYLTKPVSKGELLARIKTHLQLAKVHEATNRFVPFEFLSMLGKESLVEVERGDQVERQMSILFSDIRSFTTIVEKSSAAENFRFINSYLAHMEPCIKEHRGFVDSFIGDAIMALFDGVDVANSGKGNSSGGAEDAINAGIAMQQSLPAYNVHRLERGLVPVRIGIGVQTGVLTCGTMGGRHHIKCGVIGDSVNTASRIEGMTKMYGARFLIGEETRAALRPDHGFALRTVDRVTAKGKNVPTMILEVLDAESDAVRDRRIETLPRFEEALALYHQRAFGEARALWTELQRDDADDALVALYLKRCEAFLRTPPPPDWDGVVNLESK